MHLMERRFKLRSVKCNFELHQLAIIHLYLSVCALNNLDSLVIWHKSNPYCINFEMLAGKGPGLEPGYGFVPLLQALPGLADNQYSY